MIGMHLSMLHCLGGRGGQSKEEHKNFEPTIAAEFFVQMLHCRASLHGQNDHKMSDIVRKPTKMVTSSHCGQIIAVTMVYTTTPPPDPPSQRLHNP